MKNLKTVIRRYAKELGFDVVGFTSAEPFLRDEAAAIERIRDGLMDGLPWYTEERVHRATHPKVLLEGARSVISLGISYNTGDPDESHGGPSGKVARYAWGDDYHQVIKDKLRRFVEGLQERLGTPVKTRIFVDDGPMNDRAAAERAGKQFLLPVLDRQLPHMFLEVLVQVLAINSLFFGGHVYAR